MDFNWNSLLFPFVWVLNGLLVLLYSMAQNWYAVLLVPALVLLSMHGPNEHRRSAWSISGLTLLASLVAPMPVPVLLLVMAVAAIIGVYLEKFNPASLHWRALGGLATYSVIGIGIGLFQLYMKQAASESVLAAQGQTYIGIMGAIGIYGVPLAYLGILVQALLAHPPIPGTGKPDELINTLRARDQD